MTEKLTPELAAQIIRANAHKYDFGHGNPIVMRLGDKPICCGIGLLVMELIPHIDALLDGDEAMWDTATCVGELRVAGWELSYPVYPARAIGRVDLGIDFFIWLWNTNDLIPNAVSEFAWKQLAASLDKIKVLR